MAEYFLCKFRHTPSSKYIRHIYCKGKHYARMSERERAADRNRKLDMPRGC